MSISMFGQNDICGTEIITTSTNSDNTTNSSIYSFSTDESFLNSFPQKNINIGIWGIEKTDGTQSISHDEVNTILESLNNEFNSFNICFNLVNFSYVISDGHYDTTMSNIWPLFNTEPVSNYAGSAIRVIIPYWIEYRGVATGHDRTIVRADQEEIIGIFIHEIGHNLRLHHTHRNSNFNYCEKVTRDSNDANYNAETAGDFVVDTQASPSFYGNNSQYVSQDCNDYTGNLTDCGGTPYNITINEMQNYMAYTHQHCRTLFTTGQKIRMHEFIEHNSGGMFSNILDNNYYDLYTSNSSLDKGLEPDNQTEVIWDSPDIWVRNQPDGLTIHDHQDLEYIDDNTPVYIYVRVKNQSCNASSGDDLLKLYWAKGGIGQQTWPDVWTGLSNSSYDLDVGNQIGTETIPVLGHNDEAILEFAWYPKNPQEYENVGFTNKPWMFCFLSRIESNFDPMTTIETPNVAENTRNNNNIAYKNTTTHFVEGTNDIGSISVGNYNQLVSITSNINFFTNQGSQLWQEAEIRVRLNDDLWDAWQYSGLQSTNIRILNASEREIYISGNNSSLNNISFSPGEWGVITPRVNFLIQQVTDETYNLHISQTESNTNELLGGYTYNIIRNTSRQSFSADAKLDITQYHTQLEADDINENAVYNWYDESDNYISSGETLIINNSSLKDYKLEIIADSDGHKDYKTFTVKENRSITSISPNPTYDDLTVYYKRGSATSAFLKVTNVITGQEDNYILDLLVSYKTINLRDKSSGNYILSLITDNILVDTKQIIKN